MVPKYRKDVATNPIKNQMTFFIISPGKSDLARHGSNTFSSEGRN
jgi:hypothetical protein